MISVLSVVSSLFLSRNVYADIIPPTPVEFLSEIIPGALLSPDVPFLAKIVIIIIPIVFIIIIVSLFKYIINLGNPSTGPQFYGVFDLK